MRTTLIAISMLSVSLAIAKDPVDQGEGYTVVPQKTEEGVLFQSSQLIHFKELSYPLSVQLRRGSQVIFSHEILDGYYASLSGFIKEPGKYSIYVQVPDGSGVWGAFGGNVILKPDGQLRIQPQEIVLKLKMKPIGPDHMEVVTEKRPTLRWQPQEGALSYSVGWFEEDAKTRKVIKTRQNIATSETNLRFDEDVVSGRIYEWFVRAYGSEKEDFAYYASCYFQTK